MAKEKKDQPAQINFDGKSYKIDDLTETQRECASKVMHNQNHCNDLNNKIRTNLFLAEQLNESYGLFKKKLDQSKVELRELLK